MSFTDIRHALFTVHMWIGLILGLLLAILGLSGSLLVYDQAISDLLSPPPRATTVGQPLPLSMISDIARDTAAQQGLKIGAMQILLPQKVGEAVTVRLNGISPMGYQPAPNSPPGLQVFIDPVSGEVLGSRGFVQLPFLTFAHRLHGNFLMSREWGRPLVGWLGVAMCLLGLSGLVLWWPKRGQWKYAFQVRRTATGLRFHRELHAATGIWIFLVFMAVSFSGVVIAWPQTFGNQALGNMARAMRAPDSHTATQARPLGATEAVIAASAAVPGLQPRSIVMPARPGMPISVNYLSHGAMGAAVLVDSGSGEILAVRDPSERFLAWMRPVHDGSIGTVWRFLVFLSGLVPTLFVVTGLIMWWKKRQRRVAMTAMTDDLVAEEAAA